MTNLPTDIIIPDPSLQIWRPIPSRLDDGSCTTLSKRKLRIWTLVLESRHLTGRSERCRFGWQLLVPEACYHVAIKELRQYEAENRGWPPPTPPETLLVDNRATTLWALIAIGVFFNLTQHKINFLGHHPVDWYSLGNAHANKIMTGQWWRLVTALTLHADWQHLLGNLVIGGVFISRLCRDLRSGPAWLLLLATGIFGNLINAWLQNPTHRSVGASTAIFGAVGLLSAISMMRYRHNLRPRRRWALPVAAALGLLAMLGAGGENTDLGAHLFGFLAGILLGSGAELALERWKRPGKAVNALMVVISIGIVTFAWWSALCHGG